MQPSRRFGVADALVLVGATAAALAVTRDHWPDLLASFVPGGDAYSEHWVNFAYRLRALVFWFSWFPASWTLALLFLRLWGPRPGLRRLTRQPGMVACAVATVVISIRAVNLDITLGVLMAVSPRLPVLEWVESMDELPLIPSELGCAVAAAWTVQALGGRWRADPSWLDRMGRGLGFYWIATIPLSWFSWNVE